MLPARELRRRDGHGVDEGTAGEEAGERVRQEIAGADIVRAALRGNRLGSIGRAAAKIVFAVGADAEVGGVAIEARLEAGLEGMARGGEGEILSALKKIAVGLHHRSGRGVECLEQAVAEFYGGVGAVGCGKARRGTSDAHRGLEREPRRNGARVCRHHVALVVDVLDAEGGIDGRLVWIGGGTGEIVEVEAREKLIFRRDLVIEPDSN